MRKSKLQIEILEIMKSGSIYDDTFFIGVDELCQRTGRYQQSINRSLNLMLKKGDVVRKKSIGAINHNSWGWRYISSDRVSDEISKWGAL